MSHHHHHVDKERIVAGILQGNRHMLSRAITLVESQRIEHQQAAEAILERCMERNHQALRIGITGSPGAGKSTFIEALGEVILQQGLTLAVLAIDPSSHNSKGSILGDKARMEKLANRAEAFIRPTASSCYLGGTSPKTHEAILLCEAAGYDVIIVETVGVGQSEVAVDSMVDFILLLMLPGSGDELQGIKRGIMEIADAVAITKSDGEQAMVAALSKADFEVALHMLPRKHSFWEPQVFLTSSLQEKGIADVWQNISEFFKQAAENGALQRRREQQRRYLFATVVEEMLKKRFFSHPAIVAQKERVEEQVVQGTLSPFSATTRLLDSVFYTPQKSE